MEVNTGKNVPNVRMVFHCLAKLEKKHNIKLTKKDFSIISKQYGKGLTETSGFLGKCISTARKFDKSVIPNFSEDLEMAEMGKAENHLKSMGYIKQRSSKND